MGAPALEHKVIRETVLKIVYRNDIPHYEGSIPTLTEFNPQFIKWQFDALRLIREEWDYEKDGVLEVLLSGALGSAKSILVAHVVVTHCLNTARARAVIARRSSVDLKDSLFQMILEHIQECMVEGEDFRYNARKITFANGSEIICKSWADKRALKGRSLQFSLLAIEELTENDDEDKKAIMELRHRLGRMKHVKEQLFIAATNPDEPDHWAYAYFVVPHKKNPTGSRRVVYSVTMDNPFIPAMYRRQLLEDMDSRMARRMIHGEWLSLSKEGIYYCYNELLHEPRGDYEVDPSYPIVMSWDFNIGAGKPMSATFSQYAPKDKFNPFGAMCKHFFAEVVIEGARTQTILEEAWERGLFAHQSVYLIRGDGTAYHKDTRSNLNDYEIITNWLNAKVRDDGTKVTHIREVPRDNPPIRARHNVANAWLLNDLGEVRVLVYPKCKVLREGFKLNKLKKGAEYLEDDSKFYQHVTTAATYDIYYESNKARRGRSTVTEL